MSIKTWLLIGLVSLAFAAAAAYGAAEEPAAPAGAPTSADAAAKGLSTVLLFAVAGMAFAAVGAAFSQAITAAAALNGIARQPEASGKLFVPMILAIVFIETLAIYTLVVALLLIFSNPLTALLG
ncbi:MAG TPA: ATP synthase F0 subunit C [bacterium]|nr:ATP synthase F0 subunit C [bacterium]